MKKLMTRYLLLLLIVVSGIGAASQSIAHHNHQPTLILLTDQRFNPAVQRLLAMQELKALSIGDAQVIYVIPTPQNPMLEEVQIRYLEELIDKLKSNEPSDD